MKQAPPPSEEFASRRTRGACEDFIDGEHEVTQLDWTLKPVEQIGDQGAEIVTLPVAIAKGFPHRHLRIRDKARELRCWCRVGLAFPARIAAPLSSGL
ncbi:MAG: hypothetical protein ABR526_09460 [Chthoniobacterales bacterium]